MKIGQIAPKKGLEPEGALSMATVTILMVALAGCSPQPVAGTTAPPAKSSAHARPKAVTTAKASAPAKQLEARDWCQQFSYIEGTAAWDACVGRWKRNLAKQD